MRPVQNPHCAIPAQVIELQRVLSQDAGVEIASKYCISDSFVDSEGYANKLWEHGLRKVKRIEQYSNKIISWGM